MPRSLDRNEGHTIGTPPRKSRAANDAEFTNDIAVEICGALIRSKCAHYLFLNFCPSATKKLQIPKLKNDEFPELTFYLKL